jgi:putative ABC transport system ATP-binding protein
LRLPDDIDQYKASSLSVGQQQRVAVARALIGNPSLVIADEPTSSLDTDAQQIFLDLMFEQISNNKSTLLMVSHDRSLAERFDRLIDINEVLTRED